jgi:hypothetical protein
LSETRVWFISIDVTDAVCPPEKERWVTCLCGSSSATSTRRKARYAASDSAPMPTIMNRPSVRRPRLMYSVSMAAAPGARISTTAPLPLAVAVGGGARAKRGVC